MRFLIDADLPRSIKALLERHGHEGIDVRDVGLGSASDKQIASYAKECSLCLLSGDYDFSDLRAYPPSRYKGIVILNIPPHATASSIVSLLDGFLQQPRLVERLPGRLAIVEPGRVRIRSSSAPA